MGSEQRIPDRVKRALLARNVARDSLRQREIDLQIALAPVAGQVFSVEGVPVKVCGPVGKRYLRRIVGPEKASELREKWRSA